AAVFQALGTPGPLATSPLGLLGIEPAAPFAFFPLAVAPASGLVSHALVVPAAIGRGAAFASQAVVYDGSALVLGSPVTFVVR
ncbi:MAG: hypothetical protein WAT39_05980, partial [Planctomycetota bacterium]